jgi:hypothetical protein
MQSAKRLPDLEVASSSLRRLVERVADAAIPEWLSRRTPTSATDAATASMWGRLSAMSRTIEST